MKNDFLCACYLGFDLSDWIALFKSEFLLPQEWPGWSDLTKGKHPKSDQNQSSNDIHILSRD